VRGIAAGKGEEARRARVDYLRSSTTHARPLVSARYRHSKPSRDPTPASGYSSPVQSRVYTTIVSVAGVPTVPTQRQSVRANRFRPSDTTKGRAECVT
jgi:hypothetical protein